MQIKLFVTSNPLNTDIQDSINQFIKWKKVIDIKISESMAKTDYKDRYNQTYMVMYEEVKMVKGTNDKDGFFYEEVE